MPYEWMEPELVVDHNGVKVYRTYKDAIKDNPSDYVFTTEPSEDDRDSCSGYVFDVRDVAKDLCNAGVSVEQLSVGEVIKLGVERGIVRVPPHIVLGELAERIKDGALLDDLVHETADIHASSVNNNGPISQLNFLREHIGMEQTVEQVGRLLDTQSHKPEQTQPCS